jgi:phosphopantothenate---cysteine ligase (ATP)
MQSDTKPGIQFSLVPKMLYPLANIWAPSAYIVSFKLETDEELLLPKARQALERYQHHVCLNINHIPCCFEGFVTNEKFHPGRNCQLANHKEEMGHAS